MRIKLYSSVVAVALSLALTVNAEPAAAYNHDASEGSASGLAGTDYATASQAEAAAADQIRAAAKQQRMVMAQASQDANATREEQFRTATLLNRLQYASKGENRAERGLVICSSDADPKVLEAGQEDLSIMGRILEKALAHADEDEDHQAMGIKIFNFGNSDSPKNLLIQGYGAIFMLNVNFPLAGPVKKVDDAETKEHANSPWDETKHELYGDPSDAANAGDAKPEFDPAQVENLKKALTSALKNASNIRNLKSDETVTLVVSTESGGNAPHFAFHKDQKGGRVGGGGMSTSSTGTVTVSGGGYGGPVPPGAAWVGSSSSGHSSGGPVLTIRAKKSDIDAFGKGKLNLEEFRGKTTVLLY
ncbi:MAG TPA: hypothetical protein VH413_00305 [Verrucomicrobiae bacterium]|jgi:hypothetical protein|nr:hypothetical protein [Verrucomicrobiae bacterium]